MFASPRSVSKSGYTQFVFRKIANLSLQIYQQISVYTEQMEWGLLGLDKMANSSRTKRYTQNLAFFQLTPNVVYEVHKP